MSENDQRSRNFRTPSMALAEPWAKGVAAEMYFASMMLSNGYELYKPLVDVAIDYLAKYINGRELRFQCKFRSSLDEIGFEYTVPKNEKVKAPTHFFLMLGALPNPEFWIIPYSAVKKHSKKVEIRPGRKTHRLIMTPAVLAILDKYKDQDGLRKLTDWCLDEASEESA